MNQNKSWDQIISEFPDEWVALFEYELTGPIEVTGKIIAHHSDKKMFYKSISRLRDQYPHIAVRYTGQLIKNPEIPLLWQITHTE